MKFFLDTANIEEIRKGVSLGLVDGVTTNPSLVAKEGKSLEDVAKEICDLVDGPVSLEVVSTESKDIIEEARRLAKVHENAVVKIPMIEEGLKALKVVSQEGIRVNVTLVFQPVQGLLAAKAGATYISPFVGRLDDIGEDGMEMVAILCEMLSNYDYPASVLVASVRNPTHLIRGAQMGAEVATCPFSVLEQITHHPLTDIGLERFLADWEKVPK